jgi:hypothetical protein
LQAVELISLWINSDYEFGSLITHAQKLQEIPTLLVSMKEAAGHFLPAQVEFDPAKSRINVYPKALLNQSLGSPASSPGNDKAKIQQL